MTMTNKVLAFDKSLVPVKKMKILILLYQGTPAPMISEYLKSRTV